MRICYEQPRSVPQPCAEPTHPRPSTSQSVSRHVSQWVSSSREFAARASSRGSISTLTRPSRSRARPTIGRPTDFRHFDGLDDIPSMLNDASMPVRRRRSFRPLELSIYLPDGCGNLSPLPDFADEETWVNLPSHLTHPEEAHVRERDSRTNSVSEEPASTSYLIQRKPVANSRRSSVQSQRSTVTHERRLSGTTMGTMATPTLALLPENSHVSDQPHEKPSIRRSNTSGTASPARVLSHLPSPSRARANTAPSRPGSIRRTKTDVDDAIRELNTIIEERRASAYRSRTQSPTLTNRPPPSPSHHVPYLAPSMRMHVRSETLSDIGSAFSAPLLTKPLPATPEIITPVRRTTTGLTLTPSLLQYTGPLNSNPVTPPPATTPTTPIARLGAWIKRSTSSLALSSRPETPKTANSFYKCEIQPALPTSSSRPSTAESRRLHTRQDSQESNGTATVTLYSPDASTRPASPTSPAQSLSSIASSTPPRKLRRVPAPLTFVKDKEIAIEPELLTARSTRSIMNAKPPMSPNSDLLKGMEIAAKDVGIHARYSLMARTSTAVGMAF
ncbi:hypothetical protein ACJQWK_11883 [Exserohilum turcicum]